MGNRRYTLVIRYNSIECARVKGILNVHSQPEMRQFCAMYLAELLGKPIDTDRLSWELVPGCTAERISGVCVVHPQGCPEDEGG